MSFTAISATMVDSDGVAWLRGSWKLEFVPNPTNPNISQYQVDGTSPLNPGLLTQSGVMDNTGFFSLNAYDNTSITPVGSSWKLTVCPLSSAQCGFYVFAAAGVSLDISGALSFLMPPPRFLGVYPNYGYADIEVIPSNKPGSTYYNVVQQVQKYYNDQTQTWAVVGTGPVGPTGPQGPPGPPLPGTIVPNPQDPNNYTTVGIFYFPDGLTGPNVPTPPYGWNSQQGILEVLTGTLAGHPPYIYQRYQTATDSSNNIVGEFFIRWYGTTSTGIGWSPWAIYDPLGAVQSDLTTALFNYNLAVPAKGVVRAANAIITITALNIFNALNGSGSSSGILCFRDNTLGGAALFLVDPNAPSAQGQLLGTSEIAGLGTGGVVWNYTAGAPWAVQLTSGAVPRTLVWGFFSIT